jgi:hypothetical protein
MKRFKLHFLTLTVALAGITAACSIDSDDQNPNCQSAGYAFTDSVVGLDSTTVNTPIIINLNFKLANSCGTFKRIVEGTGNPRDVAPFVEYVGCDCEETPVLLTKPYTFSAAAPGTYVLRFAKDATPTYITKTIRVRAQ